GRAQAAVGYAEALVAAGRAARAEAVAREAIAVLAAGGDRYHEAAARLALARALAALDQPEAFDEQAAAVDLYRRLGCRWEQRRAEAALV
ncbi:MAG: LuxR family transcriptional regulator, partial [Armatimonadota bacterium]|nr:LuxR family transcriptional regulator [Armatimonadota bacterium]